MIDTADNAQDVPSPIDLRTAADAREWAERAETARPGRPQLRAAIAEELSRLASGARILELGSGPGLLAEHALARCENIALYTLFDFSEPMLELSRSRLRGTTKAEFVLGDFKAAGWANTLEKPYDAVVAMQSVHEIRHKRHVPGLYGQIRELLRRGGSLLVVDHTPNDASQRSTSLHMTAQEQLDAFSAAGFEEVQVLVTIERLILVRGTAGGW